MFLGGVVSGVWSGMTWHSCRGGDIGRTRLVAADTLVR